jgi:hypothetical protein
LLDPVTGDLSMVGGDFPMGVDVRQAVYIRLGFFRGEWFLDRATGVPYWERVFIKAPSPEHIAAIVRATILDTPGVGAITKFAFAFDTIRRRLSIEWAATTDDGEIADNLQVNV